MPLIWYRGGTVARNVCMDLEVGQRGFCKIFTLISSFMRDGVEHPTSFVEASQKSEAQRAEQ